jgi:hypothetical protein
LGSKAPFRVRVRRIRYCSHRYRTLHWLHRVSLSRTGVRSRPRSTFSFPIGPRRARRGQGIGFEPLSPATSLNGKLAPAVSADPTFALDHRNGATSFVPWHLSTLAKAHGKLGQLDDVCRRISGRHSRLRVSSRRTPGLHEPRTVLARPGQGEAIARTACSASWLVDRKPRHAI